jgi:tetratricopeptide (TPR) repeat protein
MSDNSMEIKINNDFTQDFSRMEQYALLLGGIRDYLEGKKSMIRPKEIPDILMEFIGNEINLLTIDYSFAYFGLKHQLVKEGQQEDAVKGMKELMGWDSHQSKLKVNSNLLTGQAMFQGAFSHFKEAFRYLHEALALDPNNQTAWHWLAETYKEDGEFQKAQDCRDKMKEITNKKNFQESEIEISDPNEIFKSLIKKFYDKKESIHNFLSKRGFYPNVISEDQGILSHFGNLLNEVRNFIRKKDCFLPEGQIVNVLNDIIDDLLEWMSIVSGVAYYKLKYALGSEDEENDILEAMLDILGWAEHQDLPGVGEKESYLSDDIQPTFEHKSLMENTWDILYDTVEFGILHVFVSAYEDIEVRNHVINPDELLITDEEISIGFSYPLTVKAKFEYENKSGFTRMDIFRCIYDGYKQIYDAEEKAAGDPGTYERLYNRKKSNGPYGIWGHYLEDLIIEGVSYDPKKKQVHLFIGR